MSTNKSETEQLGKAIASSLSVEKPVYDEELDLYLEPEPDYEGLNQSTGVVYVEHEGSGIGTRIFAYLEEDEAKYPQDLSRDEQDKLIDFFEAGEYEQPVDFGLNPYHTQDLEGRMD